MGPIDFETLYTPIGVAFATIAALLSPVAYGYAQQRGKQPEEGVWFWATSMGCLFLIPGWGFVLASFVFVLIAWPIVTGLKKIGRWMAKP